MRLISVAKGWLQRREDAKQLTAFAAALKANIWRGYPGQEIYGVMWLPDTGPATRALGRRFNFPHRQVAVGFKVDRP